MQDKIDAGSVGGKLERKLEIAADSLRLPPLGRRGGQAVRRREAPRGPMPPCLLSKPDMLLLDEPTNHLDAESVAWLEHFLEEYPSTVIAVTHDRYFLDKRRRVDSGTRPRPWNPMAGQLLLLAGTEKSSAWYRKNASRTRLAEKTLQRELEWVRTNPKARQAKSKARLQRYEELASQEFQKRNETNEILHPARRSAWGDLVIECKNVRKGYGDRLLIDSLSFNLPAGGIVGIIGPNGAGKNHPVPHAFPAWKNPTAARSAWVPA